VSHIDVDPYNPPWHAIGFIFSARILPPGLEVSMNQTVPRYLEPVSGTRFAVQGEAGLAG
jgi:hypothetical protein